MAAKYKRNLDILTPEDVQALINAASPTCFSGVRNAALVAFLYASGLRVSEALALRAKDLDLRDLSPHRFEFTVGRERRRASPAFSLAPHRTYNDSWSFAASSSASGSGGTRSHSSARARASRWTGAT